MILFDNFLKKMKIQCNFKILEEHIHINISEYNMTTSYEEIDDLIKNMVDEFYYITIKQKPNNLLLIICFCDIFLL